MIILYDKKNVETRLPSEEHLMTYKFCLAYLVSDLKANDLHTTAHLLEVAIESLKEPQSLLPYQSEDSPRGPSTVKGSKKKRVLKRRQPNQHFL